MIWVVETGLKWGDGVFYKLGIDFLKIIIWEILFAAVGVVYVLQEGENKHRKLNDY